MTDMRQLAKWSSVLAGLALVGFGLVSALDPGGPDPNGPAAGPAEEQVSSGIYDLLAVRPFGLDEPVTHWWRAERPQYTAGHILVLSVDPEVARRRQSAEPVLYVGAQTAERVNAGYPDGALVLIVPSEANAEGLPARDLVRAPIWFGAPALPEEVTEQMIQQALEQALVRGVQPFGRERVQAAVEQGGTPVQLRGGAELHAEAASWILRYAPGEQNLAEGLLGTSGR